MDHRSLIGSQFLYLSKKPPMRSLLAISVLLLASLPASAQSDTPCNAPLLPVAEDTCSFVTVNTAGALYQSDPANGGLAPCAFPGSPDVWYAVIVPPSGAISFTTREGSITDAGMAVYAGPCSAPVLLECDDDDAAGFMAVVDRSDFPPGDTLFIRLWKAAGSGTGTFELCAVESHADCRVATPICETTRVEGNAYGPGSNQDAFANFCDISEFQSHWFTWRFLSSGTFWFKIFPDSVATGFYPDYDWLLWQDNAPGFCSAFNNNLPPMACNGSSSTGPSGETGLDTSGTSFSVPAGPGNPFCPILNVNAGETYYLLLNNFSTSSTGFTLRLGGTAVTDCDILTSVASATSTTRNNRFDCYPVPARERVYLRAHVRTQGYTYTVLDLLGRTILPTQALQPDTYLDRATIGSGTFFVIIGNGEWREVERVVVE